MNWGLGSKSVNNEDIIINLSKLRKIEELNEEFGYVVIEPGVTQNQLSEYLEKNNSNYIIDVTGSSKETSILGNALERGIAYNSQRVESIIRLEVMDKEGAIFSTGLNHFKDSAFELKNLYPYNIGPDLRGLFFQSNLGIVIGATVKLLKKHVNLHTIQLNFYHEIDMYQAMNIFKKLCEENIIQGIPHLPNRERKISSILPMLIREFKQKNILISDTEIKKTLDFFMPTDWSGMTYVWGDAKIVKRKIKLIKKELGKYCKIKIYRNSHFKLIDYALSIFPKNKFLIVLSSFKKIFGLCVGKPTNMALGSIVTQETFEVNNRNLHEVVDREVEGFHYLLPIAPLNDKYAKLLVSLTQETLDENGFRSAITLNIISSNILEAVISVKYESKEYERVMALFEVLTNTFERNGIYPYRLPRKSKRYQNHYSDLVETLKKTTI